MKQAFFGALAAGQAAAFLLGLTAEALALPKCPHHHSVPALPASHGPVPVHPLHGSQPPAGSETARPHDSHRGAPCTCIGICHGADNSLMVADPRAASAAAPSPGSRASRIARDEWDLTRFPPFSLHYPNAPPTPRR